MKFNFTLKDILRNILVFFSLLFVLNLLSYAILLFIKKEGGPLGDHRWELPNYSENREKAKAIFEDYHKTQTEYRPFIGWRRLPYNSTTTTVNEAGDRVTPDAFPEVVKNYSVHFFGGSTMWGTGVDDAHTIPALFARLSKDSEVHNHGEKAFTSRQELALLIDLYEKGENPDVVVFYDGVNDSYHQCIKGVKDIPAHARVDFLKKAAANGRTISYGKVAKALFIDHLLDLTTEINKTQTLRKWQGECFTFDCPCDTVKVDEIAASLLHTWELAHDLVTAHGGVFTAVLQPVVFEGNPKTSHLGKDLDKPFGIAPSFEKTYDRYRQVLETAGHDWIYDFTDVFDKDEFIYIDFCHVSESGNQLVAERLWKTIQNR